jgi:hypothetical protein
MNAPANIACNGAEKTPRDNRNNAAQQNIIGVVIKTLYGLPINFLPNVCEPFKLGFSHPQNNDTKYRNLRQHTFPHGTYEIPTPTCNTSKENQTPKITDHDHYRGENALQNQGFHWRHARGM